MRNSFFLFFLLSIFLFFVMIGCQQEVAPLPLKKVTQKKWDNTNKEKTLAFDGPRNFHEYHHQIRTRAGDEKPRYQTNHKQLALQKAIKLRQEKGVSRNSALDWQELGPGNVSGRTRAVLVDKRDTTYSTWLVGASGGGIWKTIDGGQNYQLTTKGLPNMSTTTLAASDANPAIVYGGTGEGFDGQMTTGDGIYKSLDGGDTWTILTSTSNNPQFENVLRLVVDPDNPNIVLAATRRSFNLTLDTLSIPNSYIMKSIDGGASWKNVYQAEGVTGDMFAPTVQQIIADPSDFNKLFASVSKIGILKSLDKGENWERIFNAQLDSLDRIEMAISAVDPNVVYFASESLKFNEPRLYTSRDEGNNWIPMLGNFPNWLGGRAWFNNAIAAHPYDPNTVFVAGTNSFLSISLAEDSLDLGGILLGEITNESKFLNLYNPFGGEALLPIKDFADEILDTLIKQEELAAIEIRFGTGESQNAHRHMLGNDLSDTYLDYVTVPFEVWDVEKEQQLMVSFLDDDNNGEWSLNKVGPDFPDENSKEIIFIHSTIYNANQPSTELNSFLNKGIYAVFAGTIEGTELETQILPFDTVKVKTNIKSHFDASFEPILDNFGFLGGSSKGVHVDHHQIVPIPIDMEEGTFYILSTNDGGVAFSKDNGATFIQTGDTAKDGFDSAGNPISYPTIRGYNTTHFYGLDKMNGADRYIGGIQDNGNWLSPTEPDDNSVWSVLSGGDGMETAWNYLDPDLMLISSQFNNILRSADGGNTWTRSSIRGFAPFFTRIEASEQDADLVFGNSSIGVVKSTDFGLNWSIATMPTEWSFGESPIAASKASAQVVWTGLDFGETNGLFVSSDEGVSFQKTNGYDQAVLGRITGIGTHPFNSNKAYALFSIADGPKILETDDLGQTWRDISGFETNQLESNNGFPNVATYSLVVMPFDTNQIWVGTEVGLFESLDGGASWHYADNGLPAVSIYKMKIVNDEVIIATHGRGMWSASLPELADFEPNVALIGPRVAITENGFNGQLIGNINLRSSYDSSIVVISLPIADSSIIVERSVIPNNEIPDLVPFDIQIDVPIDTILEVVVTVTSYGEGTVFTDQQSILTYNVDADETPITTYSSDFDDNKSDFARRRFNILQPFNFNNNKGLHSEHPYRGSSTDGVMAIFQKPIRVEERTLLTFDEVVLVEIGAFNDFVKVEATNDNGQTWVTLDSYDSGREEDWIFAYDLGISGIPELFKSNQIGLSHFFEEGEVVYLRFRIESNFTFTGWGWMIDNIELKPQVTPVKELPATVALTNFPNPFSTATVLQYTLTEKSEVSARLYSLDGKEVRSLIETTQSAGQHTYEVNTSGLHTGVYLCRFQVNGAEQTLKWIKR